jgi:hypothetical protein
MNIKMNSTDDQATAILQMVILGVTIVSLIASEILPFVEKIKPNGILHGIVLALSNIKTRERNASTRQGG